MAEDFTGRQIIEVFEERLDVIQRNELLNEILSILGDTPFKKL